jgi:signal peptidase I
MSEPKRGDVIVFRSPADRRTVFVKRLIGLPGDSVQVKEGRVFLNGAVLQREDMPRHVLKVAYDGPKEVVTWREILPEGGSHAIIETEGDKGFLDDTPVFRVPRQSYFVLGDNRDNSNDSRVAPANRGLGFISDDLLVGKVVGGWGGL